MLNNRPDIAAKFQKSDIKKGTNHSVSLAWTKASGKLVITWNRIGGMGQFIEHENVREEAVRGILERYKSEGYTAIRLKERKAKKENEVIDTDLDEKTQELVHFIRAEAMNHINSYLAVDLSTIDEMQLAMARNILGQVAEAYKLRDKERVVELAQEYFLTIPTEMEVLGDPMRIASSLVANLQTQYDRLAQLEAAISDTDGAIASTKIWNIDGTPQAEEYLKLIGPHKVVGLFGVEIPMERAMWKANKHGTNNIRRLFHGSHSGNFHSILESGLVIPEHAANGSRLGRGIYFADQAQKSINYTRSTTQSGISMILICDVALGRMWKTEGSADGIDLTKFESAWGTNSHGGMDEYVVYRLSQQTIIALALIEN